MDSDDENLITYGTPVVTDDNEEEVPRKKPIPIEHQIVTDERGLRRFHGAFTGGFSAGYFNTVGSKEGWSPATFLSSRSSRSDKNAQRPEDFMDDEDLGAFGIAPRGFRVNKKFGEVGSTENQRKRPFFGLNESIIPGAAPLKDLIIPVRESIGINILRKMGWKPGQGIGPRIHLKEKLKMNERKKIQAGVKVYGCSLPDDNINDYNDENEEELRGITFAPDDVRIDSLKTKEDCHGLGYVGLNKNPILSTFRDDNRRALPFVDKSKKLAIAGEAFGVGAYEDDDESIYTMEDMSQYDFEIGGDNSKVPTHQKDKGQQFASVGYVRKELEGFHLSAKPLPSKKFYPLPVLPKNFQPFHKTLPDKQNTSSLAAEGENHGLDRHRMTALERTVVVSNETPSSSTGSVFDHLRPEDRVRLQEIRKTTESRCAVSNNASGPKLVNSFLQLHSVSSKGFKPFAQDEDKQKRYELYQKLKESNKEDVFSKCQPTSMTEWEKQREQEEFRRAAVIYKPLSTSMASRFVSAKHSDVMGQLTTDVMTTATTILNENDKTTASVREKVEWHPDRLLCRRFNVPHPYPDSTVVGIPNVKRDKYSIFNLLSASETPTSYAARESVSQEVDVIPNCTTTMDVPVKKSELPKQNTASSLFACLEGKETKVTVSQPVNKEQIVEDVSETPVQRPTMDLFKTIFCNTDSEANSESDDKSVEEQQHIESHPKETASPNATQKPNISAEPSIVQKTSDHLMGVFSNIDFDAMNRKPENCSAEIKKINSVAVKGIATIETSKITASSESVLASNYYGPSLPPNLIQTTPPAIHVLEKSEVSRLPLREDIRTPKVKKDKKKHKHKHKKKHKHSRQQSRLKSASDDSSSEEPEDFEKDLLQRIKTFKRSQRH